jgi:SsrA-binding protein
MDFKELENRKARFNYHFINTYVAGIKLHGSEIKAIREGKANIKEAYCIFVRGELFIKGMHINEYSKSAHYAHDKVRLRKLLLTKRELRRLQAKMKEQGHTIVPVRLFINERGFAKLEIALAKGKKKYDKRQSIKEREFKRKVREY